jgi:hypothetical protein
MTSTKARGAGLGAVATFAGVAASLGWTGIAHADDTGAAFGTDHEHTNCSIDRNDIQFAPADTQGAPVGGWQTATGFHRLPDEPLNGIVVRIANDHGRPADPGCTRTISLASYTAGGPTWETSALQGFVGVAHVTLDQAHTTGVLTVPLPTGADGKACFGQLDLYFGDTVYDGKTGPGHGPLPHYPDSTTPPPRHLIAAWNGGSDKCTPPVKPPPPSPTPTTPTSSRSTPPSSAPSSTPPSLPSTPDTPSTPVSSTPGAPATPPATPTASGSTPPVADASTPPATTTSTPGTPTLAHTGSDAGLISLVALAFFGAGGTAVVASRKAAAARKH